MQQHKNNWGIKSEVHEIKKNECLTLPVWQSQLEVFRTYKKLLSVCWGQRYEEAEPSRVQTNRPWADRPVRNFIETC